MQHKHMVAAAVAGLLGLGVASGALAADPKGMEKCWGAAKAGKNDCGSNATSHACASQSKADYDANDFKYVKTGTCLKVGGSLKQGESGKLGMMKKG
jgi:uncharacterized membrane protein